jgi:hypothetical protein
MSMTFDEIMAARRTLQLRNEDLVHVEAREARETLERIEMRFAGSSSRRWWWEGFRSFTSVTFDDRMAFTRISKVVADPDERLWFVVEDDVEAFLLFESTARVAQAIIGECFGFEYYLVPKTLHWLLCENHHDSFIAVGESVRARLHDVATAEGGTDVWERP